MTDNICNKCSRVLPPDAPDSLCPYCLLALGDEAITEDESLVRGRFKPPEVSELQPHFAQDTLQIVDLIGSGGMGAVYHAKQPRLMRDVALKILPPELATSPGFDDRFAREARVLAKLNHSSVVDVYDFGKAGPYSYLMLEFVDGVNLRDLMFGGVMAPADAFEIIPQICDALQYAHDQGVVHRDIKPENILVDTDGKIKITDFGLAKLARPDASQRVLTGSYQVMGTPNYMAPEQIEKPRQVDHRADIYALGVVFYELLTGELPLGRFDPPSHMGRGSRRLDKVVMKTLEKEPNRRYEHASEVKDDVQKAVRDPGCPNETAESEVDHASQFVSGVRLAANSARESTREFLARRPRLAKLAFPAMIAAFYFAIYMLVSSLFAFLLLSPIFAAVAYGLSLWIDRRAEAQVPEGFYAKLLWLPKRIARIGRDASHSTVSSPQKFVADSVVQASRSADVDQASTDPILQPTPDPIVESPEQEEAFSKIGDSTAVSRMATTMWGLMSLIGGAIAVGFGVLMFSDRDFGWIAGPALLIGFVIARLVLSLVSADQLSWIQKCLLYPSIGLTQFVIGVPLLVGPPAILAMLLPFSSRPVTVAVFLVVGMLWAAALLTLSRWYRGATRFAAHPFLRRWDGEWTIFGSLVFGAGAAVMVALAIVIAN
ncbi:MAG: serine/threonine protein kinase [Rubripirellula sp.]